MCSSVRVCGFMSISVTRKGEKGLIVHTFIYTKKVPRLVCEPWNLMEFIVLPVHPVYVYGDAVGGEQCGGVGYLITFTPLMMLIPLTGAASFWPAML